jgi:hypothetical protein
MLYTDYREVPWHRRSGMNNIFVLLGMLGLFPFALWTAVNLVTGGVYFAKKGPDGYLKRWGIVNTLWAIGVLCVWGYVAYVVLYGLVMEGNAPAWLLEGEAETGG